MWHHKRCVKLHQFHVITVYVLFNRMNETREKLIKYRNKESNFHVVSSILIILKRNMHDYQSCSTSLDFFSCVRDKMKDTHPIPLLWHPAIIITEAMTLNFNSLSDEWHKNFRISNFLINLFLHLLTSISLIY